MSKKPSQQTLNPQILQSLHPSNLNPFKLQILQIHLIMSQQALESLDALSLPSAPEILDDDTEEQERKKNLWFNIELKQYHEQKCKIYELV